MLIHYICAMSEDRHVQILQLVSYVSDIRREFMRSILSPDCVNLTLWSKTESGSDEASLAAFLVS